MSKNTDIFSWILDSEGIDNTYIFSFKLFKEDNKLGSLQ